MATSFDNGASRGAGFAFGAQCSDSNRAYRRSLSTAVSSQLFDADFNVAGACDFSGADTDDRAFESSRNSPIARVAANRSPVSEALEEDRHL